MQSIISTLNDWIWSQALIYLCLAAGLFYSIVLVFPQVRHFKEMLRLLFNNKSSDQGISSFQALSVALSGRVGTGNIAGVAAAITFGGPGAVFWMWMVAFLGAATAYVEATLGQIYKEVDDLGQYRGGPAYYFEKCFGSWYGIIFAIATILACGMFLPGVQANAIANAANAAFGDGKQVVQILGMEIAKVKFITLAAVLLLIILIIFGGIKRIAQVTQVVVPFMALGYIIMALIVCIMNITALPGIIGMIVSDAFTAQAGFGAAIGWGVKRGIYSNEAGQGTAPHAAAAAEVDHPAQQGLVQAFSVYIDTLFVCSATAFMILLTGAYNIEPANVVNITAEMANLVGDDIPGDTAANTQLALGTLFGAQFGSIFVAIALFLFAFTTILAYYYMAETNAVYLSRFFKGEKAMIFVVKLLILFFVTYGILNSSGYVWDLGDVGVGLMAWLNIVGILLIFVLKGQPTVKTLKDYEAQKKAGVSKYTFDPIKLGIKGATFWENRLKK